MKKVIVEKSTLFSGKSSDYTSSTINVSGWTSFAIQVNSSGSGTLKIQGSIDESNWVDLEVNSAGATSIALAASPVLINFRDIAFPFIRLNLTGSVTGASAILCIKDN